MMRHLIAAAVLCLSAFAQSAMPELPADIPKDAVIYTAVMSGNPAGQQATWHDPDGTVHVFFQFNDRGRGPKTYSAYRLGKNRVPEKIDITGNDYMKSAVDEHFAVSGGRAQWKSSSENESRPYDGQFFSSLNGAPEELAMLAKAMLANGGQLALLPSGEPSIQKVREMKVVGSGGDGNATLYAITGLDLTPTYLWLDDKQQLFAQGATWFIVIKPGFETAAADLVKAQEEADRERASQLVKAAVARPAGQLFITDVTIFDSISGKAIPHQEVAIKENRIVQVGEYRATHRQPKAGEVVIDGSGKTLLPGLWDMHQHFSGADPLLDIATGVTTGRDMANDIDYLSALRKRIDAGEEIGPRIIPAGFIDSPGPFQGPTKILAANARQARDYVAMYQKLGYPQIKMYSSLKPEIVPEVIEEAHKRGMRVSGHIPANMTAEQCIRLGQDEIQHMNFIFLNFMPDVKETRNPSRFSEPGKRAAGLDLNSPAVRDFVQLMKDHHIVLDPTMTAWEGTYTDRPGKMSQTFAAVADRLPAQVQRGFKAAGQALPVTAETDKLYRDSYDKFKAMLKLLFDSGVTIVPGTDNFAGFAYQRELEIYVESGIPAAEVLKMATLGSARVMSKDKELGSIEAGKLADLVLIDGDPTKNISDVRKVRTVIKDGNVYDPAKILTSLGIKP
jgi:imidazolonepropionase-like amidohydrolase